MNCAKYISQASGLAGEITHYRRRNKTINHAVCERGESIFSAVLYLGLPFCIVGLIGGLIVAGFMGGLYGAGGGLVGPTAFAIVVSTGLGIIKGIGYGVADSLRASYRQRHLFFNHNGVYDVAKSLVTAISSCLISLCLALKQLAIFFGYVGLALGKIIRGKEMGYIINVGYASDAFVKIFSNLTAAVFHPLMNLCMAYDAEEEPRLSQDFPSPRAGRRENP